MRLLAMAAGQAKLLGMPRTSAFIERAIHAAERETEWRRKFKRKGKTE